MADEKQPVPATEYGYQSDEVKQNPFDFGLNAGVAYLKDFKWIPNGGKEGAEQSALEIIFVINDTEKSYRKFPVTHGYKNNVKVEDPTSKEFKEAVSDFNSTIVHILRAFADEMTVQTALSKKLVTDDKFKEFCTFAAGVLPKDYSKKKLDIFLQYQWSIAEGKNRTYLDIPTNMKHGKWLSPAREGKWQERIVKDPADNVREALYYVKVNDKGEVVNDAKGQPIKHDFIRKGWFVNSNFAKQQREAGDDAEAGTEGEAAAGEAQNQTAAKKTEW